MIAPPVINLTRENGLRDCSELLYTLIAYKHTHTCVCLCMRARATALHPAFLSCICADDSLTTCQVTKYSKKIVYMINDGTKMALYFCYIQLISCNVKFINLHKFKWK